VNSSNHAAAKAVYAVAGIVTLAVLCEAAHLASRARGAMAGYELIAVVFAACWIIRSFRSLLHPAPRPRASVPVMPSRTAPDALAESQHPARIAA
jgi:hypothetical protein